MPACKDITYVLDKLSWMRAERIWPNGQRYTWTDAFGVVLLVSLYAELVKLRFLDEAEWVVSDISTIWRCGCTPSLYWRAMCQPIDARASISCTKFTPHLLCREEASSGR